MKGLRLIAFVGCLIVLLASTGCFGGGGGGSASTGSYYAGGSSSGGGSSYTGGSGSTGGGSGISIFEHGPEPATLALLGSGLVAYALMMRNKRKKK